uniref:Uncharacterized protein TCIL3000_4_1530 n=1 Tax=Trypanosoma congolense (strain IL3000) TaxID=1068625 RepID=G0UL13_TRYCI|nr:unnamed protein product [Trypanosoma congolense IL3000]
MLDTGSEKIIIIIITGEVFQHDQTNHSYCNTYDEEVIGRWTRKISSQTAQDGGNRLPGCMCKPSNISTPSLPCIVKNDIKVIKKKIVIILPNITTHNNINDGNNNHNNNSDSNERIYIYIYIYKSMRTIKDHFPATFFHWLHFSSSFPLLHRLYAIK